MSNSIAFSHSEQQAFITRTYGWMAFALLVSAVAAFVTASSPAIVLALFGNRAIGFWILCIAEIILVMILSAKIRTMSLTTAVIGFMAYSIIDGITLSSIFFVYRIDSIAAAFFGCAAMFALMSFYGATTKRNLLSLGHYLMMALLGIIIASAVQFVIGFFTSTPLTMLNILISGATVIVFTGLTAYDSQKIVKTAQSAKDNDDYKKVSILAALELYLDFINLFLALLRLFGKRK